MNTVTVESREAVQGSWTQKVQECKAIRAFAAIKQKKPNDVTLVQIEKTDLGVKGYAELYDRCPSAAPKPGGDGSAAKPGGKKRSAPAGEEPKPADAAPGNPGNDKPGKAAKRDNTASVKEKEVRELLALEQSSDNTMTSIATSMAQEPQWWLWARDAVNLYKQERTEVLKIYVDKPWFQDFKVAALSPKETQKVKKALGEDYVGKLVEYITVLGPKIQSMAQAAFQVEHMARAKRTTAESLNQRSAPKSKASKAKAKGKAKGGPARRASSKSLEGAGA